MNMQKRAHSVQGFTLVEIMVIVIIMSIFFLVVGNVFYSLSKGTFLSKARTIATNLAQEKVEFLKDYSYNRLMVTKVEDLYPLGPEYDRNYYPPETLSVGNITFTRTICVMKVKETGTGSDRKITEVLPDNPDTGLKKISISIKWQEGNTTKEYRLSNLRNDPNRSPLDCRIYGTVKSGGSPVAGVRMYVIQNLNWEVYTQSNGYYEINTTSGQYNVKATKNGYWDIISGPLTLLADAAVEYSPSISPKLFGYVTGYAAINDHPVIGQVIASTVSPLGFDQETVTFYNPTTNYYLIAEGSSTATTTFYFMLKYVNDDNNYDPSPCIPLVYAITGYHYFVPYGYILIANTSPVTIGGVSKPADIVYDWTNSNIIAKNNDVISADKAGGIVLTVNNDTQIVDRVAWGDKNWPVFKAPPANATEGSGYVYPGGSKFPNPNWRLDRHSYVGLVIGIDDGNAPCYDTDMNNRDFYHRWCSGSRLWNSASTPAMPNTGRPALGGIVTCNDPLASSASCFMLIGNPPYSGGSNTYVAYFSISTTTGTWIVMISSNNYYMEVSSVVVVANQTVTIPNPATNPSFPNVDFRYRTVILSSPATNGMVTGYVKTSADAGISNILVRMDVNSTRTDSAGKYILRASTDDYVEANPSNDNPAYSSDVTANEIQIVLGGIVNAPDLIIHGAGQINGWVTSNRIDGLSGVVILAQSGGLSYTAQSGSNGKFLMQNVTTGTYTIYPVLDTAESYTSDVGVNMPVTKAVIQGAIVWSSTFVVAGTYGTIYGKVYKGNNLIKTGVLLVATTSTIGDYLDPVSLDNINSLSYYAAVSKDDGTYEISVRRNSSKKYNVYGWFTEMSGSGTTTTKRSKEGATGVWVTDTYPSVELNFGPGAGAGSW